MSVKDIFDIIRRNVVQPVVISIYTLAILLLQFGETRDALFMSGVITFNTLFAIVQEIRAKIALHKLELMNQPLARIPLDDGTYREIPYTDVKVGDTLALLPGDEVPADATVIESRGLEVNESMLTGESLPIPKEVDAVVLSSTAVVAGSALVKVTAVGKDTKAGEMTAKLKAYRPEMTPLQVLINRIIFYLTFVALGLIALIALVYWNDGYDMRTTLKTITSAGITVIPEGLLLASTLLLAFGSLKLAAQKVLPQKLSAIEGMALLEVLCTDKTGTLTSDEITFDRVEPLNNTPEDTLRKLTGTAAELIGGGSATSDAVIRGVSSHAGAKQVEILAFSSSRKMSGARFTVGKKQHSIILGAPEYVEKYGAISDTDRETIAQYAREGLRVLLVASMPVDVSLKKMKLGSGKALGLIVLRNELREGVVTTVKFLQKRGVSLRVISGDNPDTVSYIAASAGVKNAKNVVTGAELQALEHDEAAWKRKVLSSTIYARVLPEQKESIIATFQAEGKYTGMVGDGVNDALALKKSNLGVAMYAGATATRRVADIVLLNNSFNSLPVGMRLGNRIMQAIEIIAVLSFHKIIYGITILLLTMLVGHQYPFLPRHNTFMNIFAMTLPTIMWTLFPPLPRHRVNPKNFWKDTLQAILPIGLVTGFAVFLCEFIINEFYELPHMPIGTVTVIVTTILSMSMVLQSGRIMGVKQTRSTLIARLAYVGAALVVAAGGFGISILRDFFDFNYPNGMSIASFWPLGIIVVVTIAIQYVLVNVARNRIIKRSIVVDAKN